MYIYKIVNTNNNKIYVGQTTKKSIFFRWNNHKALLAKNKHTNIQMQLDWNECNGKGFICEIIVSANSLNELDKLEQNYISLFNAFDKDFGYNLTSGGKNGTKYAEESKQKIRLKAIGRKITDETKKKMSISKIGYVPWIKGKSFTEESKHKMSIAKIGKKSWNAGKKMNHKWSEHFRKKVICLDNNKIYESIKAAADDLKLNQTKISAVCRGVRNKTGNMKFKFYDGN